MTTVTLNNNNANIMTCFANIAREIELNVACSTLEMECAYLNARGQDRITLTTIANTMVGSLVGQIGDVIEEREVTVYPQGTGAKKQSLNASLKMVALYSALVSGYTDQKTIATALANWLLEDSVNESLDTEELALELITQMIAAEILDSELGRAITPEGAHYEAHGLTNNILALRDNTAHRLFDKAQPRMQPMKHKITWKLNGTCEIKNLRLINGDSIPTQEFIDAANYASHTGYKVNAMIRQDLELWLEAAEMPELPENEVEAMKAMNKHDDKVRIVEELLLLPINETMYFPHTADWRGRMYARGGLTQFQSIKECKAIFDFAEESVITNPTGLYLHVANAHGMDKVSITDRKQWVMENMQDIIDGKLANDIYARRSAYALAEYQATGATAVICHIDGTCNGTQWTSAIYRDAKTAKLVNVRESSLDDVPFDLYGTIAERAEKLATGIEKAAIVKHGRNLTKAPIMVLGYGAGDDTLLRTVTEYLQERNERANPKKVLKAIMTAIKLEAPALTKLTDNLKRILKANPVNRLTWKAFDLTVKAMNVNTDHLNLHGSSYTAKLAGKAEQDCDALMRGLSPNYVHSLDSAHLRDVTRINGENGIQLSCIHDSVGAPANKVLEVNESIRTSFHKLNQIDLVENIYNALGKEYTAQQGTLDIDEVLKATYIFS